MAVGSPKSSQGTASANVTPENGRSNEREPGDINMGLRQVAAWR